MCQVVVGAAQGHEVRQVGRPVVGRGPVDHVVGLAPVEWAVAPEPGASRVHGAQGGPLGVGGGAEPPPDVDRDAPLVEHDLADHGVAGATLSGGDRHRDAAVGLAHGGIVGGALDQGGGVDDEGDRRATHRRGGRGSREPAHQGVGREAAVERYRGCRAVDHLRRLVGPAAQPGHLRLDRRADQLELLRSEGAGEPADATPALPEAQLGLRGLVGRADLLPDPLQHPPQVATERVDRQAAGRIEQGALVRRQRLPLGLGRLVERSGHGVEVAGADSPFGQGRCERWHHSRRRRPARLGPRQRRRHRAPAAEDRVRPGTLSGGSQVGGLVRRPQQQRSDRPLHEPTSSDDLIELQWIEPG